MNCLFQNHLNGIPIYRTARKTWRCRVLQRHDILGSLENLLSRF